MREKNKRKVNDYDLTRKYFLRAIYMSFHKKENILEELKEYTLKSTSSLSSTLKEDLYSYYFLIKQKIEDIVKISYHKGVSLGLITACLKNTDIDILLDIVNELNSNPSDKDIKKLLDTMILFILDKIYQYNALIFDGDIVLYSELSELNIVKAQEYLLKVKALKLYKVY